MVISFIIHGYFGIRNHCLLLHVCIKKIQANNFAHTVKRHVQKQKTKEANCYFLFLTAAQQGNPASVLQPCIFSELFLNDD